MNKELKKIQHINEKINLPKEKPDINGRIYSETAIQEMVKKMRKLYEIENRKTVYDQSREEEKFRNAFDDLNVTIEFIPLKVYNDYIFWGGTIDGIIQFVYKVTPDEKTSGVDFNYLDDFSVDNPDNQEIIDRVEKYYDQFYQYWRDNIFQT